MNDPANRTFVCSVLFVDIVEYSKRSVAEQMRLKQRFNVLLQQSLAGVAVDDRIVLDTGDGAAVSFLGNPEDALGVGMALRNAIAAESQSGLSVRIGVNLGAVRLIKDLNGQMNIVGDAINVAQRIMGFAAPGQILVSRSYYELVYRLDPQFELLFNYEGARTDKHVREHEIYAVAPGTEPLPQFLSGAGRSSLAGRAKRALFLWSPRFNTRLGIALPAAMAVIIAAGVIVRVQRAAPPLPEADAATDSASPRKPRQGAGGAQESAAQSADRRQGARRPGEREGQASVQQGAAAAQLLIVPWGEVIVDGHRRGVSPPLRILEMSPGTHSIEIRNGDFPPHTEELSLAAGQRVTIRHRFN